MLSDLARTELAELAVKATPGPWSAADEHGLMPGATPAWCVSRMGDETPDGPDDRQYLYDVAYTTGTNEQADAEFIAAARTAVPELLQALTEAEAKLANVKTRTIYGIDWGDGDLDYPYLTAEEAQRTLEGSKLPDGEDDGARVVQAQESYGLDAWVPVAAALGGAE